MEKKIEISVKGIKHFKGLTLDMRTNLWGWTCGNCGKKGHDEIDTMFAYASRTCLKCKAFNTFDLNED